MSKALSVLTRQSVKQLLKTTLKETTEKIIAYLDDFTQTRDVESLHQYRVNIRLARSVCLEFGEFMEDGRKKLLDEKLKTLQKQSNELRDIDVFLESLEAYATLMDSSYEEEFRALKMQLEHEKEACLMFFMSQDEMAFRQKTMAQLAKLPHDENLCLPHSEGKMLQHVQKILQKRFKKIVKLSKKLSLKTSNERFHKLRLQYKKLRYTADALHLDAFSRSFKPLQSAFGKVQDKNSQIERIKRYYTPQSAALEHIVHLLEEELIVDKTVCIEKSSQEKMEKIAQKLDKIFTCKES